MFEPLDAPADVDGTPYVVFPGNVGAPPALADAVTVLRHLRPRPVTAAATH